MRTKKELLEFFLKKVKLWDRFIADNILVWSYMDDDLVSLERYHSEHKSAKRNIPESVICLWNIDYLQARINKGFLSDCELAQALSELAEFAGLNAYNAGEMLENEDSVMEIIEKVYRATAH